MTKLVPNGCGMQDNKLQVIGWLHFCIDILSFFEMVYMEDQSSGEPGYWQLLGVLTVVELINGSLEEGGAAQALGHTRMMDQWNHAIDYFTTCTRRYKQYAQEDADMQKQSKLAYARRRSSSASKKLAKFMARMRERESPEVLMEEVPSYALKGSVRDAGLIERTVFTEAAKDAPDVLPPVDPEDVEGLDFEIQELRRAGKVRRIKTFRVFDHEE